MARFVTAGAIDLKLGTHVPLGNRNSETKFRLFLIPGLATRGPNVKTEKMRFLPYYWSEKFEKIMVGTSTNKTSHIIRVFDLTYFSRSQRSKRAGGAAIQQEWHVL